MTFCKFEWVPAPKCLIKRKSYRLCRHPAKTKKYTCKISWILIEACSMTETDRGGPLHPGASLSCFLVARKPPPPLAPTCTHCTQPRSHRFISSSTLSSKYLPRTALPSMKKTLETRSLLVSRSKGHIHDRSNCYCTYIWNSTVCTCVERTICRICGRGFENFRMAVCAGWLTPHAHAQTHELRVPGGPS